MRIGVGDTVEYKDSSGNISYLKIYGVKAGEVYFFRVSSTGDRLEQKLWKIPGHTLKGKTQIHKRWNER